MVIPDDDNSEKRLRSTIGRKTKLSGSRALNIMQKILSLQALIH